jgi:hypothetical protein
MNGENDSRSTETTPTNLVAEFMPMGRAPLALEVVILHWGLYATVHRINFQGQAQKCLGSLMIRIHRHDITISIWASGPLPLKIDRSTIVLWDDPQPSVVPGEER